LRLLLTISQSSDHKGLIAWEDVETRTKTPSASFPPKLQAEQPTRSPILQQELITFVINCVNLYVCEENFFFLIIKKPQTKKSPQDSIFFAFFEFFVVGISSHGDENLLQTTYCVYNITS
jgi:hypothetical protein